MSALKVGDTVVIGASFCGNPPRAIRMAKIVRETPTRWIVDGDGAFRKSDGAGIPVYTPEPRTLYSAEAFAAATVTS